MPAYSAIFAGKTAGAFHRVVTVGHQLVIAGGPSFSITKSCLPSGWPADFPREEGTVVPFLDGVEDHDWQEVSTLAGETVIPVTTS